MRRIVLLAAAVLLAACSGAADTGTTGPADGTTTPGSATGPADGATTPGSATGPGLSIEEARDTDSGGPLLVNGYIVAEADVVRLCSGLAESLPPQCVEPSLEVVGIDLDAYPVREAQGVAWTDEPVQVLGEVDGDVLHVSAEASG